MKTAWKLFWIIYRILWCYLIIGTGYAWAWQSKAKLWPMARVYEKLLESVLKEGALAPNGSKETKKIRVVEFKEF